MKYTVVIYDPEQDETHTVHLQAPNPDDAAQEAALREGLDTLPHIVAAVIPGHHDNYA